MAMRITANRNTGCVSSSIHVRDLGRDAGISDEANAIRCYTLAPSDTIAFSACPAHADLSFISGSSLSRPELLTHN